ncbi:MAG: hypothetical protein LH614_22060 [Pyrinomonadaceae bacterium]|nr:hypothetical protein [Pyrinomonadaceae bacterium]
MQKVVTGNSAKKFSSIGVIWLGCLLFTGCAEPSVYSQRNIKSPKPAATQRTTIKKKEKMSEEKNYPVVDRETAQKELESFIFELSYGRKVEPRNLDPTHVEEFLRQRLDRSKEPASFERARQVVDFYDLTSVVDHFEKMLSRSEKDARELLQSVEMVRILGEQGTTDQQKKALEYHDWLVKSPFAEKEFKALTEAIDSFQTFAPNTLTEAMKKQHPILKERGKDHLKGNSEAMFINGLAEEIFTLQNSRLPQLLGVLESRRTILNAASPKEKPEKLTLVYLEQMPVSSPRWAARQLRRESREGKTDAVIDSLRKSFKAVKDEKYEEEEEISFLLSAARAVRFFGAELNDAEKNLIKNGDVYQIDFLDRDIYNGDK